MPRAILSSGSLTLPRLNAAAAIALAQSLESAATAPLKKTGKAAKLPPHVTGNLAAMRTGRLALQKQVGQAPASHADIHAADVEEDLALRALYSVLSGWALLAGRLPAGDAAAAALSTLFSDGIAFINLPVLQEWAVVESKLESLDAAATSHVGAVGGAPLLDHLKTVHATYGETIGATKPTAPTESPKVGKARTALLATMRQYLAAVAGTVVVGDKASAATCKRLLKPYVNWVSPDGGKTAGKSGTTKKTTTAPPTAGAPPTPPAAPTPSTPSTPSPSMPSTPAK